MVAAYALECPWLYRKMSHADRTKNTLVRGPGQALELGSSAFEQLEWCGHEPTS
jgi:hypothetical protein